jgi:D-arabinose 1-dehydrogenase-like Zn-dependent alcohol dehydrogenase
LAKELGAHHYIDTQTSDPSSELNKLGGAKVILSTITNAKAVQAVLNGLSENGKLVVVGAADGPLEILPMWLIRGKHSVSGWASGSSMDSQETMDFSALTGVRSMNEVFPLEKAAEAYERMMSGKARFRVVLVTGH